MARNVTQEDDTLKAKDEFIKILNRSEMFYNKRDIPKNESSPAAHKLCSSVPGAKIFCPVRWNAMQNWFAHAREVSSKQIQEVNLLQQFLLRQYVDNFLIW